NFNRKNFNAVWGLLKENGLRDNTEGLKTLVTKLENRLNLNHQYTILNEKPWIDLPGKPFDLVTFSHFSQKLTRAINSRFMVEELGIVSDYLSGEKVSHKGLLKFLEELVALAERLEGNMESW